MLRNKLRSLSNSVPDESAHLFSLEISQKVLALPEVRTATRFACFAALQTEVSLSLLFSKLTDKELFFPRFQNDHYVLSRIEAYPDGFQAGKYQIDEPDPTLPTISQNEAKTAIDIWLIPGLGFDRNMNRLGRGKGYYDQFLKDATGLKIGVGFDCQICESIPVDPWDIQMDHVITESLHLKAS
ncbi:MAG: 5-formyltetrahydrofolate cyclo-ligase [Candidatus Marinamargulisbacteria bacterium]|jgi:5-formyltetrahydrofolate cyclo-ligase